MAKRLELLHELDPQRRSIAVLLNPTIRIARTTQAVSGSRALGLQLQSSMRARGREIDAAFATLRASGPTRCFVGADALFQPAHRNLLHLAARHGLPAIYPLRDFVDSRRPDDATGPMSRTYRQVGVYAGRILKGAKPADLPVEQSTKFEFVINLKTAKALGLEIPPSCSPAPTR